MLRRSLLVLVGCLVACGGADDADPAQVADTGLGDLLDDGPFADPDALAVDAAGTDATSDGGVKTDAGGKPDAKPDGAADSAADAGGVKASAAAIEAIASASSCDGYSWKDRGTAPAGYVPGVALVFARALCAPTRPDVVLVSKAKTTDTARDALAWYDAIFSGLSMSNGVAGVDTLRHAYTLLLGLGMRESSGQHCVGRDMSATNVSSDSAEAGAWQTSWDSRGASTLLPPIFAKYRTSDVGCHLATFKKGVTCSAADWKNWGTGVDGLDFQKREKECPTMAAEYAAVMLRVSGGSSGHYGPLRTRAAEVRPECDAMFKKVQAYVTANPSVCGML